MKSKSKIKRQVKKKTNLDIVRTVLESSKNKEWLKISSILAGSGKNKSNINLGKIENESKTGEKIVVPGKILSTGDLTKKITLVALNFSEQAKEKILKSGSSFLTILEEIKQNPEGKGIKILK